MVTVASPCIPSIQMVPQGKVRWAVLQRSGVFMEVGKKTNFSRSSNVYYRHQFYLQACNAKWDMRKKEKKQSLRVTEEAAYTGTS